MRPPKLGDIKTGVDIAKVVLDASIALVEARRAAREAREKREADEKDKRIAELEAEVAKLKATGKP